ncbi:RusA family crossover junction endodeoxyribonuclease [Chloroflexota bacterium]
MVEIRKPAFRIWVQGHPQSVQGTPKHLAQHRERIAESARQVVPYPAKSKRIDIEIYFQSRRPLRPDVDNIIKPILDALNGIVYFDDSQVRSIRVAAFPVDEPYGISGPTSVEILDRLFKASANEFLIDIYEGLTLHGGPA